MCLIAMIVYMVLVRNGQINPSIKIGFWTFVCFLYLSLIDSRVLLKLCSMTYNELCFLQSDVCGIALDQ